MYCNKCGRKLKADDFFCPQCGTKVDREEFEALSQFDGEDFESANIKTRRIKGLTKDAEESLKIIDSFFTQSEEKEEIQKKLNEEFEMLSNSSSSDEEEELITLELFDTESEEETPVVEIKVAPEEIEEIEIIEEAVEAEEGEEVEEPEEVAETEEVSETEEELGAEEVEVIEIIEEPDEVEEPEIVEEIETPEEPEPVDEETRAHAEAIAGDIEDSIERIRTRISNMGVDIDTENIDSKFSNIEMEASATLAMINKMLGNREARKIVRPAEEVPTRNASEETVETAEQAENESEVSEQQDAEEETKEAILDPEVEEKLDATPMGLIKKILYVVLTLALLIAAILSVGLTVARNTPFGEAIHSGVEKVQNIFTGEEEEEQQQVEETGLATQEETNEGEPSETEESQQAQQSQQAQAGEATQEGQAPQEGEATQEGQTPQEAVPVAEGVKLAEIQATDSLIGKAIAANVDKSANINLIVENPELKFPSFKEFAVEGADKAIAFDNDLWYTAENGENKHYSTEIVGKSIEYFSKLMDKKSKGDDAVIDLIVKGSKLFNDVSAIKSDHLVVHTISKMEIGEIRKNGDDVYLLVTLTETTGDEKPDETYTRVLRYNTLERDLRVREIGEAK